MSCPPNKILNPSTGRCVLRTGRIGRKLLSPKGRHTPLKKRKSRRRSPPKKSRRKRLPPCGSGKVRSPVSNRCVKIGGPAHRSLRSIRKTSKSRKKTSIKKRSPKKEMQKETEKETELKMEMEHNAKVLYSLYDKGYAFPRRSITYLYRENNIDELGPLTKIYYDSEDNKADVQQLVRMREPCNIGMDQCFDVQKFEGIFGWRSSYYYAYFQKYGKPAPNIGIYCYTPIFIHGSPLVHIYNAIALAFDDKKQPDYVYYMGQKHKDEIFEAYVKIFYKIFMCAKNKGLETIVFSLIGAGAFSSLFYKFTDMKYVYVPALLKARELSGFSGQILFMGSGASNLEEVWTKRGMEYRDIGYFPDNLKKVNLLTTLFVNAWDPHSFAGNGNASDSSLDGFIGRVSAIALLCSSLTNFYLKYQPVEMKF